MNYNKANINSVRPQVPDGVFSISDLLRDPLYHQTFSQVQSNPVYTKNWAQILSPCDGFKDMIIQCNRESPTKGFEEEHEAKCTLFVQRWFVCAAKQLDFKVYDKFHNCIQKNENLERCSQEYEDCVTIVKESKENYDQEWQLTEEEVNSLFDCTGLMEKSNRATERYGPNSQEADKAFSDWLDCFVKTTCGEQYNSMLNCIKTKGNQLKCIDEGHSLVACSSRQTLRYGNSMSQFNIEEV